MTERPKTREEHKRLKQEQSQQEEQKATSTEKVKVRLVPIWLRLIILVGLIAISVIAGALVGYGPLGGGKATDVFKVSTWTHIHDLVDKK